MPGLAWSIWAPRRVALRTTQTASGSPGRRRRRRSFSPAVGGQADLLLNYVDADFDSWGAYTRTEIDGAGHLFHREPDRFLLGVIGQIGKTSSDYADMDYTEGDTHGFLGLEGQAFAGMTTLYGQAGFVHSAAENSDDYYVGAEADGWFATGEVRYFLDPNFRIDLHGGLSQLTSSPEGQNDVSHNLTVGAGVEYRLAGMPISLFGAVDFQRTTYDFWPDNDLTTERALVGIRFNLGTETLLERDRSGASLKPVDPALASYDVERQLQ